MPIAGQNSGNLDTIRMDFTCRRYDTFSETFNIEYYDTDGVLQEVDLTGAYAQMWVKKRKTDTTPVLVMDINISGNELTISKDKDSMSLAAGSYWHDIEIMDADDNHITWVEGRFYVVEHVTEFVREVEKEIKYLLETALSYSEGVFTKLVSSFQVAVSWATSLMPKYVSKATFSDDVTVKTIFWIIKHYLRPGSATKLEAIINWLDGLKYKFIAGFSMVLTDSTIIQENPYGYFSQSLRIMGQIPEELTWYVQYDNGSSLTSEEI